MKKLLFMMILCLVMSATLANIVEASDDWTWFYKAGSGNQYYYRGLMHLNSRSYCRVKKISNGNDEIYTYSFEEISGNVYFHADYGSEPGGTGTSEFRRGTIQESDVAYNLWIYVVEPGRRLFLRGKGY